jgi:hypothetical protein
MGLKERFRKLIKRITASLDVKGLYILLVEPISAYNGGFFQSVYSLQAL